MPTGVLRLISPDPFAGVTFSSVALRVTDEQKKLIQGVLDVACSDTQFRNKAYNAIVKILTSDSFKLPQVLSLNPNNAVLGSPSFTLRVLGTGFKNTDKIIFAGVEEPTTFVSANELTTGVNMAVWLGPDVLPVEVQTVEGYLSNAVPFTFTV